ncbi:mannitol dehydrogenase family protein, partial [Rhizobium sp. BR5]
IKAKDDPMAFLSLDDIFGKVAESALFRKRFAHALTTLWQDGTAKTLQLYLDDKLAEK